MLLAKVSLWGVLVGLLLCGASIVAARLEAFEATRATSLAGLVVLVTSLLGLSNAAKSGR